MKSHFLIIACCCGAKENREKHLAQQKKYREDNRERNSKWSKKYYKETLKEKLNKCKEDLSDSYVKNLLTADSSLGYGDIPQGLIEAKRELMKIKRFIKKENQK